MFVVSCWRSEDKVKSFFWWTRRELNPRVKCDVIIVYVRTLFNVRTSDSKQIKLASYVSAVQVKKYVALKAHTSLVV